MNCLIGTFVSIRRGSSVSAVTERLPGGAPHLRFHPVISIPGVTLKVASCSPARHTLIYFTTYTHTHLIQMTFADD